MNANQINKHLRSLGVVIRRGNGYYYWLDANKDLVVYAESVYVYRASDLPLERWIELAKAAATHR